MDPLVRGKRFCSTLISDRTPRIRILAATPTGTRISISRTDANLHPRETSVLRKRDPCRIGAGLLVQVADAQLRKVQLRLASTCFKQ